MIERDVERINLSILNGELEVADRDLARLQPQSTIDRRIIGHYQGILAFRRGDIALAKDKMEHILETCGENVNLLRDLTVCHYHLQDMVAFRTSLNSLERLLSEKEAQLSHQSLFECELTVGKLLEEEARIIPALDFYTRALNRSASLMQRLRALVQKARWHALFEPNAELSEYYRELISIPRHKLTHDLYIELEHSLMLIELRLIGADHAWQRITRVGVNLSAMDQRLLCFDYIEGAITQDFDLSDLVLQKMNSFEHLDPFEEFVKKIVEGSLDSTAKLQELTLLTPQLPWASYLRLLCLASNVESHSSTRQELNRKILLIIRSLDTRSQALWSRRLKQSLQTPEIRIEYSTRNRCVAVQGRHVDLSKKKMGMQLLEGLVQKAELTVDEAIYLLWQSSFTPEHYHRLRMGIHRLNTLINKVTGLGKIIEVDSQNVRLRPEVKIRQADLSLRENELINI